MSPKHVHRAGTTAVFAGDGCDRHRAGHPGDWRPGRPVHKVAPRPDVHRRGIAAHLSHGDTEPRHMTRRSQARGGAGRERPHDAAPLAWLADPVRGRLHLACLRGVLLTGGRGGPRVRAHPRGVPDRGRHVRRHRHDLRRGRLSAPRARAARPCSPVTPSTSSRASWRAGRCCSTTSSSSPSPRLRPPNTWRCSGRRWATPARRCCCRSRLSPSSCSRASVASIGAASTASGLSSSARSRSSS